MSINGFLHRIKQNHAIEHATVSILAQSGRPLHLVGRSDWNGFYLYGDVETELVRWAAQEGLARLKAGQSRLAIHPRCGTNLAVSVLLSGMAAYTASSLRSSSRTARLNRSFLAILGALAVAQPLGTLVQRYLTTTTDLADVLGIGEVRREVRGGVVVHYVPIVRQEVL
ncbi:MAG: hypothetical protein H5T69_07065 [Chloroflexi bacterium]|nr:hypothetical protein [Chloroflexota bacterium]